MHVFKALKKHFLITFARNRTFLSISNTALAENLLRQVSNFTLEILDHQYWAPILTHDWKRPQIVAPANQQVCFAFMVWVMWLAAVKGFVSASLPTVEGKSFIRPNGCLMRRRRFWDSPGTPLILCSHVHHLLLAPSHTLAHYTDMLISLHKLSMQLNHVMSAETLAVLSSHDRPVLD